MMSPTAPLARCRTSLLSPRGRSVARRSLRPFRSSASRLTLSRTCRLELSTCECLNAKVDHPLFNALAEERRMDSNLVLRSDVDPELLVILRFRTLVKVSGLQLHAPRGTGPSSVRVFANPIGLDCESAASLPATQTLELKEGDESQLALRLVLFSKVSSLALFFPANHEGAEQTVIQRIAVFGTPVPQEGAAWAKDPELQDARRKGDWLGKGQQS